MKKSYDNHNILHNFNYQFKDNKSYALVGKSGSGKTTLLNIIGRLELPDKGDILIDDDNLKTIPEKILQRLSWIFISKLWFNR